jgi:hypothetical protein
MSLSKMKDIKPSNDTILLGFTVIKKLPLILIFRFFL